MKIAYPPATTNKEPNLRKQVQVFNLVVDHNYDDVLVYATDCPELPHVHSGEYLDAVRTGGKVNGFADFDYRKVMHAETSCAAMCTAALLAIRAPASEAIAFAPVSGFHHAGWGRGGGYCTFNGLVAAAVLLKKLNLANKVLILDGDGHYGDGTDSIKDHLGLDWLLNWHIGRKDPYHLWSDALDRALLSVDMVFYQAGADAHIDDSYGVGHLSTGDFMQRDRFIFSACKRRGVPIVWNLAGGYNGAQTLDLHTSTFESAVMVYYPGQMEKRRTIARGATVVPASREPEELNPRPSDPDRR